MEVNDTLGAPATVPATTLAVAADHYFELRTAATRVVCVWIELQEQLSDLQNISSEQRWRNFAGSLHSLRVELAALAALLRSEQAS